ncbi:MAG: YbaN family protein, partial [Herbaspirillum sp.]
QYLRDYEENRGIPLRAKIIALLLLWPSMIYSASLVRFVALKIMLIIIASGVTIYLLRIKTLQRDDTEQPPLV